MRLLQRLKRAAFALATRRHRIALVAVPARRAGSLALVQRQTPRPLAGLPRTALPVWHSARRSRAASAFCKDRAQISVPLPRVHQNAWICARLLDAGTARTPCKAPAAARRVLREHGAKTHPGDRLLTHERIAFVAARPPSTKHARTPGAGFRREYSMTPKQSDGRERSRSCVRGHGTVAGCTGNHRRSPDFPPVCYSQVGLCFRSPNPGSWKSR